MKQYFAYCRVSTVKQGERGVSLVEQKSAIEAYATRNNLSITEWFEEMETAAKQGRRVFTKMLAELHRGKAQGLLVHKIDRSARNLRDWVDIGELVDQGVDVRYVNDNVDLMSTGGRLSADIIAAVSANYVRNLREEVKKGMYGRLKQGLYPWQAPLGYLNQGGGRPKVIDPVKGPLVRYLFERYGTNTVSFRALRRELYEKGLKTPSDKPLAFTTLSLVLHNPFYIGVIKIGTTGETYAGVHEPLISKTLFERVQSILAGKTVPRTKRHEFLFRQMIRCENCGKRRLTGETHKGFTYYRCHHERCRGMSWSQDAIEEAALKQIRRVRFVGDGGTRGTNSHAGGGAPSGDVGDFGDIAADIYRSRDGDRERIRTSLTIRLQQIDVRTTKLTDLLIDEAVDRETYNQRKEQLVMERRGVLDELEKLSERSPAVALFEEFERNNRELLRYESMADVEKRELLEIVCSNFSASRESLTITLRSPYREIAEMEDSDECPPERSDVRMRKVIQILKKVAEESIDRGMDHISSPSSPNEMP